MPSAWRTSWPARAIRETAAMAEADLVILNTCHIREKAAEKVYSELGRVQGAEARAARPQGRETTIVVAGCVAQAEGEEILRRAPAVDVVVGPQTYHRLPELLAKAARRPASSTRNSRPRTSSTTCPHRRPGPTREPRRLGLPHDPGRLRQVLHLLRRALYARRRGLAPGGARSSRRRSASRRRACARSP